MIVIIGAGITGLALAHALEHRHIEHLVLEASTRAGGAIRSTLAGGRVLEAGPQRGRLSAPLRDLVGEIGLEQELLLAPTDLSLLIFRDGRLRTAPLTARELVRTDLLSTWGKLRLLAEPFVVRRAEAASSAAQVLRRRVGEEAYAHFLGPLFGGLYASDPAQMPAGIALLPLLEDLGLRDRSLVAAALRRRSQPARAFSFLRGMQSLTDRLYERHRAAVRLGCVVSGLRVSGSGITVTAGGERISAREVVLTVPADDASRVLRSAAPAAAERLAQLRYNPLAIAYLESDAPLHGYGYQVSLAEPTETRGVTFNDSLFGHVVAPSPDPTLGPGNGRARLFTAFLGGALRPSIHDMPADWIAEVACNEFRRATGDDATAIGMERARIPAWDRSWAGLEGLTLPEGIHLATNYESRIGIGGRLARATSLAARLAATR
ncbi:MAG: protoporphyrinogen oxidase [Longimicrobiales bacterium]